MFFRRLRQLPWWAISLSLGVNVIALASAIFLIDFFRDSTPLIVVGFLFIHIFISQPLKDWLIARLSIWSDLQPFSRSTNFENRVQKIIRLEDVLDFLRWLIRSWKLTRIRVVLFDEKNIVYFVTAGKAPRKMAVREKIPEALYVEMMKNKSGAYVNILEQSVKNYLQARMVRYIVPLLFRDKLIGVIGFSENFDKSRENSILKATQRISLAIENQKLERTVPRSEFLKQEFRLAERIEKHLNGVSHFQVEGYSIQKLDTAWEKKNFAAIFGCASGKELHFVMLLRLQHASTRSNALQLFTTQGYFHSLAGGMRSVSELAEALNVCIVQNEKQKFSLEGFLVSLSVETRRVEILVFGTHLAYRASSWEWVPECPPLGIQGFSVKNRIVLDAPKELILSMRDYPLVLIGSFE